MKPMPMLCNLPWNANVQNIEYSYGAKESALVFWVVECGVHFVSIGMKRA